MRKNLSLSSFIAFLGRTYIALGVVWLIGAIFDNGILELAKRVTPLIGVILALVVYLAVILIVKTRLDFKQGIYTVQMTILIILGCFIILSADSIDCPRLYGYYMFTMSIVDLLGILLIKQSGTKNGKKGITATLIAIVSLAITVAIIPLGIFLAKPVSKAIKSIATFVKDIFVWIASQISKFIYWVYSLIPKGDSSYVNPEEHFMDFETYEAELKEIPEVSYILIKALGIIMAIAIIGGLSFLLIRYLFRLSIRKRKEILTGESYENNRRNFKDLVANIKARIKLKSNKESISYILFRLERIARIKYKIRHEDSETINEFIQKILNKYSGDKPYLLNDFASFFNESIYGENIDWLKRFENGHLLLKEVKKYH